MCFHEFEEKADAIIDVLTGKPEDALDIIVGNVEPSGLLPFQMPKDMKDAYTQSTDTPRDMECYTDSMGNTYDFGFGLNWSGVIDDERTAKYCVAPLLVPEHESDESMIVR